MEINYSLNMKKETVQMVSYILLLRAINGY